MKSRDTGDAPMDILIGHGYLGELVWFETSHPGSQASPHIYQNSKALLRRGGGGGALLHEQPPLLEVKTKITLLRSTFNTCVIHRANCFLLIQICVLFLQISGRSEPLDVNDPETCRRMVWGTSQHVRQCLWGPRFWSKCKKCDSMATTNRTFFVACLKKKGKLKCNDKNGQSTTIEIKALACGVFQRCSPSYGGRFHLRAWQNGRFWPARLRLLKKTKGVCFVPKLLMKCPLWISGSDCDTIVYTFSSLA